MEHNPELEVQSYMENFKKQLAQRSSEDVREERRQKEADQPKKKSRGGIGNAYRVERSKLHKDMANETDPVKYEVLRAKSKALMKENKKRAKANKRELNRLAKEKVNHTRAPRHSINREQERPRASVPPPEVTPFQHPQAAGLVPAYASNGSPGSTTALTERTRRTQYYPQASLRVHREAYAPTRAGMTTRDSGDLGAAQLFMPAPAYDPNIWSEEH